MYQYLLIQATLTNSVGDTRDGLNGSETAIPIQDISKGRLTCDSILRITAFEKGATAMRCSMRLRGTIKD